jgi:polyphosphate kinase 2 (PPK2 family)
MKSSPLDAAAQEKWDAYTATRDETLRRTHTAQAPWICVRSDQKKAARLNIIRHLVHALAPPEIADGLDKPDRKVLFPFELAALTDGRLER